MSAIAACEAAWELYGGVFRVLRPDNTKAIVVLADPLYARITPAFLEYAQARGFHVDPARARSPIRARGYRFCVDRVRGLLAHVDAIRLDHFRAFAAAWHVPAGAPTAQSGQWKPGPGADFFRTLRKELGGLPFLAEDLGIITSDVSALRDEFHLPGTRVLQFAFDGDAKNPHLPENCAHNLVGYTGTHDNATTRGWYEDLPDRERANLWRYLKRPAGSAADVSPASLRVLWSSAAALAIAPLQDILNLGREARMNQNGSAGGNWRWRATDDMLSSPAFESLRELTRAAARSPTEKR